MSFKEGSPGVLGRAGVIGRGSSGGDGGGELGGGGRWSHKLVALTPNILHVVGQMSEILELADQPAGAGNDFQPSDNAFRIWSRVCTV